MEIRLTLKEVRRNCDDWEKFCDDFGYSVYAVKEGGGHIQVTFNKEQAQEHGIIPTENESNGNPLYGG